MSRQPHNRMIIALQIACMNEKDHIQHIVEGTSTSDNTRFLDTFDSGGDDGGGDNNNKQWTHMWKSVCKNRKIRS